MDARSNRRQVSDARVRTLGKPVAVCTEESWLDLLKPQRERLAELDAAQEDALSSDDGTEGLLLALGQAVEQRDHTMAGHCERLAFIAVAMGVVMGWDAPVCWRYTAVAICMTWARWGFRIRFCSGPALSTRRNG